MIILDLEQRTPEWYAARCGVLSASNFDKIITTKGEPSKSAQKYLYQLAGERVSGRVEETYQNAAMQRGIEMEAQAREFYELVNDVQVQQVGLCFFDNTRRVAASPDGLVGDDGCLEIKCPLIYTHVGYLVNGGLSEEYFQQAQGQLFVTGRKWVDLISYFPGIRPVIVRLERDEKFISSLSKQLDQLCKDLYEITEKIR